MPDGITCGVFVCRCLRQLTNHFGPAAHHRACALADYTIPSGDNRATPTFKYSFTEITETRANDTNTETESHRATMSSTITTTAIIQLTDDTLWSRLTPRQPTATRQRDEEFRFIPTTRSTSPVFESDESSELTDTSTPSSQFTFSPATWTPRGTNPNTQQSSPIPTPVIFQDQSDEIDMEDITNCSFMGKPEDQDPQDFMNRLERIILMKTGFSEAEKVRFLELSLKAKSPAATWFTTLTKANKASFASVRDAFELRWPVKAITEKTTAEKQALLDETVLKTGDLGRRVAASVGAEEELSHVVWADKVERLAGDIPDTNNLLVASTRKKLPKPLLKLVGRKPMTWKELADAVRDITLEELMEKMEEERELTRYTVATPNTPSKALGAAFRGINIAPHIPEPAPHQYRPAQTNLQPTSSFSADKPAHERLADVLSKALTMHPRTAEGMALYNAQIALWQATHGQSGRGPNETRPYPLTPGTVPVASGECWKCGHRTHHPGPCSSSPVPALETKWRSIAQSIRKRAEAAVVPAVSVNLVAEDSSKVHTYEPEELAYLQQLANQEKGEGSSM